MKQEQPVPGFEETILLMSAPALQAMLESALASYLDVETAPNGNPQRPDETFAKIGALIAGELWLRELRARREEAEADWIAARDAKRAERSKPSS